MRYLKWGNEVIEVPKGSKLYHGTNSKAIDSITEKGLLTNYTNYNGEYVWLTPDDGDALHWAEYNIAEFKLGWDAKPIVLEISVDDLDFNLLEIDYYNDDYMDTILEEKGYLTFDDCTYMYKGDIEPNLIYK